MVLHWILLVCICVYVACSTVLLNDVVIICWIGKFEYLTMADFNLASVTITYKYLIICTIILVTVYQKLPSQTPWQILSTHYAVVYLNCSRVFLYSFVVAVTVYCSLEICNLSLKKFHGWWYPRKIFTQNWS